MGSFNTKKLAYHEDVLQLVHVVNALCEQLTLHLVGDLFDAVSPVCHLFCLRSLSFSLDYERCAKLARLNFGVS